MEVETVIDDAEIVNIISLNAGSAQDFSDYDKSIHKMIIGENIAEEQNIDDNRIEKQNRAEKRGEKLNIDEEMGEKHKNYEKSRSRQDIDENLTEMQNIYEIIAGKQTINDNYPERNINYEYYLKQQMIGGINAENRKRDEFNLEKQKNVAENLKNIRNIAEKQIIDENYTSTMETDTQDIYMDVNIPVEDELRQFDVLDDLDRHREESTSDSDTYANESSDSDVPDEEIEAMLEEGLPEEFRRKRKECKDFAPYEEKEKLVLDEIGHNHFDVLPEGWVQVTHNSGMPLYLHKHSRVCTLSKPYFLGAGSVRKHEVPVSAVPCLQYRRALLEEHEEKEKEKEKEQTTATDSCNLPSAKIETVQENRAAHSLDSEQLRKYCLSLFRFKAIKVMRFQSWSARRKFTKSKKHRKQLERPTLPDGTKLITFPIASSTASGNNDNNEQESGGGTRPPKHWIMNPSGKSYVCILHEYVQHALKKQPTYTFKELENAATPYSAVVCINEMEYGYGFGSSKKQAKANAARKTLEILIPQMKDKISGDSNTDGVSSNAGWAIKAAKGDSDADLSFFDEISITDPRVAEFCAKTTEPSPHAILITCLQRNFGQGDMQIDYSVNTLKHQRNEFTMRVGKHEVTVVCRNKKDGKQRAAQEILQRLHPHIHSWGSLLRLYGSRSVKTFKEKKQLEQEITLLQGKATVNQPNHAILGKLKQEMKKLAEQRKAMQPIGKFVSSDLPSGSAANLNNVDL